MNVVTDNGFELCPSCVIARANVESANKVAADHAMYRDLYRQAAIAALRMAQRAGGRPTTDDERALVALFDLEASLPAAQRRIGYVDVPPVPRKQYVEETARMLQLRLLAEGAA